jgi:hypothetical protein
MSPHQPQSQPQTLRERQTRHLITQLCLVALLTLLFCLIVLTHNDEFERPGFVLTKFALCFGLVLTYAAEGLWSYG